MPAHELTKTTPMDFDPVVTEPTPVPQNTLVIPRDLAPIGSTLWVNWVLGDRVGPGASIRVSRTL